MNTLVLYAPEQHWVEDHERIMRRIARWARKALSIGQADRISFPDMFKNFKEILELNNRTLDLIASANDKLSGNYVFDRHYIDTTCKEIADLVLQLIYLLNNMVPDKYQGLIEAYQRIESEIKRILEGQLVSYTDKYILFYKDISSHDLIEAVGEKNAHLAELYTALNLNVPRGFAVTTTAYFSFMEYNDLAPRIKKILGRWLAKELTLEQASKEIKELILAGRVPRRLRKEIEQAAKRIVEEDPAKIGLFAVRSSAVGEDSEFSFAGQYTSKINVPLDMLIPAYKDVIASTYNERAMEYRKAKGFGEEEIAMAVAVQQIVRPRASGVLYTFDPVRPENETMLINATWGLGAQVVEGKVPCDNFSVERNPPYRIMDIKVVRKQTALTPGKGGETKVEEVAQDMQTMPSLTNEQIRSLAEIGLQIEKFYRKPQDIEFAIDETSQICILQARQIPVKREAIPKASELPKILKKYPVIFTGKGEVAQEGIASGRVWVVQRDADLVDVPMGSILVAKNASPRLGKVIRQVNGIITEIGSTTGHLATIAREFRIPTIMNLENATRVLHTGQEITMDAQENTIYEGIIKELKYYSLAEDEIEETYEYRLLRRVLKKIEPLNLLDPSDKNFTPQACVTLHDITRFIHEKAVDAIIDYNYNHPYSPNSTARKLEWKFPLDMIIIDIGGGLVTRGHNGTVTPEQVVSVPLQAILKGISHPRSWDNTPVSVDFGSFMSSLTRTFSAEVASPRYVGQNLAVISKEYANLSLRLGYHFTMVDAYIVDNINDNYAYFRFFGGVTETTRRARRARFLAEVLTRHDFRVELHGDLVVGRIKKMSKQVMLQRLYLLGVLIGFTRQLDIRMVSDRHVADFVEKLEELMEEDNGYQ